MAVNRNNCTVLTGIKCLVLAVQHSTDLDLPSNLRRSEQMALFLRETRAFADLSVLLDIASWYFVDECCSVVPVALLMYDASTFVLASQPKIVLTLIALQSLRWTKR